MSFAETVLLGALAFAFGVVVAIVLAGLRSGGAALAYVLLPLAYIGLGAILLGFTQSRVGNLVFGSVRDGNLVALDAATGKHLWHFPTGANMAASPISYAVGGRQFVAVAAGNVIYAFALASQGK